MTIRVLVVDDSATARALLVHKLEAAADISICAQASNAMEARKLIKQTDPDVVTLDIEMPGMDGLSFLEKIMELRPTPVIVVSGRTEEGAEITARALEIGAVNCYAKSRQSKTLADDDNGELIGLVREAAKARMPAPKKKRQGIERRAVPRATSNRAARSAPSLIAVGSSTGGIEALHTLLSGFPADCPPTVIVQHVNACFAPAIAESLNRSARPLVRMAESDLTLTRGTVYFAPGGEKHLLIAGSANGGFRTKLRAGDLISGHRPSVDALFGSVAQVAGATACGVLLTGMGEDGAKGLLKMRNQGAHTIAQDDKSCVVFGMPRAAINMGAACEVLPLGSISQNIFTSEVAHV